MNPMVTNPYTILVVSIALSTIPVILMGCTSFLKINIVFGLIKNALGTQNAPGVLITALLSLVLTGYIMRPTFDAMYRVYLETDVKPEQVLSTPAEQQKLLAILKPYQIFVFNHSDMKSKKLFTELRAESSPNIAGDNSEQDEQSLFVLIPAFMLSELKDAFRIGILLLLPFLVVDLIICNILAGLGMHMVNPLTIGLPVKLFLFFSADCWTLLVKALILSYR